MTTPLNSDDIYHILNMNVGGTPKTPMIIHNAGIDDDNRYDIVVTGTRAEMKAIMLRAHLSEKYRLSDFEIWLEELRAGK